MPNKKSALFIYYTTGFILGSLAGFLIGLAIGLHNG